MARFIPAAMRARVERSASPVSFDYGSELEAGWSLVGGGLPLGVTTEYPYAARVVPIIFAIIDRLASDMAAAPIKFWRRQRNGKPVQIDPLDKGLPAERWRYMNPHQSALAVELRRTVSMEESGNAYLLVDRGKGGKLGPDMLNLYLLPGHRVTPETRDDVTVDRYRYHSRSGSVHTYEPDQVIAFHGWNDDGAIIGLSRLQVLRNTWQTGLAASRFQREFYRKGTNVAGVFTTEKGSPTALDDAERRLKARYQGLESAMDPVILAGGLKFERRGLTFTEMAFLESVRFGLEEVCRVYGVPPVMLGIKEGGGLSDAGATTDASRYVDGALDPRAMQRDDVITDRFCRLWADDIFAKTDLSGMVSVAMQRLALAKAAAEATKRAVVTVDEVRPWIGEEPTGEEGADKLHIPATPSLTVGAGAEAKVDARAAERAAIRGWGLAIRDRDEAFFDEGDWRRKLAALLLEIAEDVGAAALSALASKAAVDWASAAVAAELGNRAGQAIDFLTDTTRKLLREELAALTGPDSDATFADVVNAIRKVYDGRRDNALTAAQTEAHAASMFATDHAWSESGVVEAREWVTAGDDVVRESHVDVSQRGPVKSGEPFVLYDSAGGEHHAMYPGDRDLPAELSINCRCIMEAVVSERAARAGAAWDGNTRASWNRERARADRKVLRFLRSMYDAMEADSIAAAESGALRGPARKTVAPDAGEPLPWLA